MKQKTMLELWKEAEELLSYLNKKKEKDDLAFVSQYLNIETDKLESIRMGLTEEEKN